MDYRKWHEESFVADTFQEISDDYVFDFLLREESLLNGDEESAFDRVYLPLLKKQGVNLVHLAVGGDHVAQILYSAAEDRFWDAHKKLDILNTEEEPGCSSFLLCRNRSDLKKARASGRVALIAGISGGRPLEGKPNLSLLFSLRSLYRLGLRSLQLTGNGRNRLADGCAQVITKGKLTQFGVSVCREAMRLKMIIDTSQLSDYGFYDLLEVTDGYPVIDSHTACAELAPFARNISDKRIRSVAERGGVIGVSFRCALLAPQKERADGDDLLRHIDRIVEVAGIDAVALGPDFSSFKTPVNRDAVRGYGNLGPDFTEYDRQTPAQSEKHPGIIGGLDYGIRQNDFVAGPENIENFPRISELLLRRFTEEEAGKILGMNFYNFCLRVLPE